MGAGFRTDPETNALIDIGFPPLRKEMLLLSATGRLSSKLLLLFPFWSPEPNELNISGYEISLHSK